MNHPLTHQSDGSFDVISSILSVHYYDSCDFISIFANDSLAYKNMTGYDYKYTGLITDQWANGFLSTIVSANL